MATITTFERALGYATEAGHTLYTVQADSTITIIGAVFNNVTAEPRTMNLKLVTGDFPNGVELIPTDLPVPSGSGFTPSADIGKIVAKVGDQIVVDCDEDNGISAFVSFMLQVEV